MQTTQLYEMIVVRHGLMIVGLPFSGKTASYRFVTVWRGPTASRELRLQLHSGGHGCPFQSYT